MRVLEHSSISEKIYDILSERIINQQLKPHQRLKEEQLASELGVSRTPLRDALTRLARDGFVQIEPRRGASVKKFNIDDVKEVYDIRMALEGLAARLAIPNIERGTLEKLMLRFAKGGRKNLIEADSELHNLIIRSCGNKRLMAILSNLHSLINAFRVAGYSREKSSAQATTEHTHILEAFMKKNGKRAEELLRKHISRSKQDIVDNYYSGKK